ncbi:MAG: hypothetical protein MR210_02975 [Erysipelotrichaceae bacterium]|nr:hypothetical protein [Erysipelotrichaceae bacterium]
MNNKSNNKPKSFNSFYSKKKKKIIDFNSFLDCINKNEETLSNYTGDMFCPECKKAELTFVHKTSKKCAYLRRKTQHKQDCSYNNEYDKKITTLYYFKDLDDDQIKDKLESALYVLFKEKADNKTSDENIAISENDNEIVFKFTKERKTILKTLRKKSMDSWIDKEKDNDQCYLFYGKVKLKAEKKISKTKRKYYILKIYTYNSVANEWKYKTSIYRNNIEDIVDENAVYKFVAIGIASFMKEAFGLNLIRDSAIKYQRI